MNMNVHENHRLLFGIIFFGFIGLTLIIAVGPALWVQDNNAPLPGSRDLTAQEKRGLSVYVSEGCLYCHTQQVRPLTMETPFGRPSAPGDFARLGPQDLWRMTPAVLGTERTGPDLSNIGNRQPSATWHYIHLYNPRAVVRESIMQAYPWLFTVKDSPAEQDIVVPVPPGYAPVEGKVVATQTAQDLVAYLLSLKQIRIPGVEAAPERSAPSSEGKTGPAEGASLYAAHCAGCHQTNGEGVPGTFPPLKGDPKVTDEDPSDMIRTVLFGLDDEVINGTEYSAEMPAFGEELSDAEIAAVINHERTSWGNNAPVITVQHVAKIRKEGPREGQHDD
jgi:cytochrome c oxidase cbb3-type subunit 2